MNREGLTQALAQVLREEIGIYRSLVDLLQEEQRGLIKADIETLEEIEKKKETIYLKIKLLEESRHDLTCKLQEFEPGVSGEVTLTKIIEGSKGCCTSDLRECQSELRTLFTAVSNLVKMNERLVGRSLDYLRGAVSIMGALARDLPVYGQNGTVSGADGAARIVSKKV
jgi:flagellar biosynthesis/type III secretory pathway chaperone